MDDLLRNNAYKILELFIQFPNKDFYLREIARKLRINHSTVLRYIKRLLELNLVKKKEEHLYPTYYANTENKNYLFYKQHYIQYDIINSGLIEKIQRKTLASSIVLFGSCAKGTFTEQSDIDLFVESEDQKLDLSTYEKQLKRHINLLFEPRIRNISEKLRHNIINGIVLYGFIKI